MLTYRTCELGCKLSNRRYCSGNYCKKVKDLRITICPDIKVAEHGGIETSKGNQIPWLISRNITYKEKKLSIPLYKAIVRLRLAYNIQACKKDIYTKKEYRGEQLK